MLGQMIDVKKLPFEERSQCAAYMRATHNMSQVEIGVVLGGLSQPHVSRLLKHAERQNYLVIEQRFVKEQFSDEWIRQMDELLAPSGLNSDLKEYCVRNGLRSPRLGVFESGPGNTEAALAQRRTRFGRTASGRLTELIEKSDVIGVAWGRTIKSLAEGIAASRQPIDKSRKTEFAAVCAELVSLAQHGYSASRLAGTFDELFNEKQEESPQLTGFPAYIPRHYDETMRRSIWQYISDTPGFHRVFSGPDALIDKMDMLISSVGSSSTPVLGSFEELVQAGGLRADDLRQLVVGDLGGILIPRTGISQIKMDLIDELNGLWTGIKTEHVKAIADRAFDDPNQSGVVVVAIQKERGDTVFELISRGLVNELLIDHAAAEQLHNRVAEALTD
ncbi:hypothetical protein DS906_08445 [Ruegeria sp. A3M17]|nr:hypothetical protein DS906_08445 [Ruegeria sp. A3M17]